ncbi:MAG TPA: GNAT family protein [Chloroflexota bacterium]|nr:GNAT family protein [Chloroflexota bacterium]
MIELQRWTPADVPLLLAWVDSPARLVEWAGPAAFTYPLDEGQLLRHLEPATGTEPRLLAFRASERQTGDLAGYIELANIQRDHRSATISRVMVAPHLRGRGIGTQMVREVLRIGFEELKLHRVGLGVFAHNHSALACYRKAGFVEEGLLRDNLRMGDAYWSLCLMSVLEHEWRAARS